MTEGTGMQIDLSTVLGIFSTLVSGGIGAWVAMARVAISNREKEIDRRIDEVRALTSTIDARLHIEEKATIRQDGDVRLVQNTHNNLSDDIREIKRTMATKTELSHISHQVDKILERIEGPRRHTPGTMQNPTIQPYQETTNPPKAPIR